ncbi:MAG TPA: DUF4142 domain-containing protein [Noviherbaspirillum sp.]
MQQHNILTRMFRVGLLALMFGATSVHAQSGKTESGKDSAGLTQENKAGKMSPTGQNETTSATPSASGTSDSSGASGSSGQSASGAGTSTESRKDSAGLTQENKSGQMSPTGQNETSSVAPASGASSTAGQSASGASDSSAGKSASGKLSKADQNLMREMAYANLAEIETGKIALNQSKNEEVRNFAQKMIDDHTQAQKELEQLAQSKGVTLPTEPDKKHQAAAKKLSALEGDKFDKQYMSQGGMRDHRNTHKLLERAQKRATDADVKSLAAKMEPIVSQHLTLARDVTSTKNTASGSMGSAGTSATSSGTGSSGDAGTSGASGTSGSSNSTGPGKQ